jgi:hypothetical protein
MRSESGKMGTATSILSAWGPGTGLTQVSGRGTYPPLGPTRYSAAQQYVMHENE